MRCGVWGKKGCDHYFLYHLYQDFFQFMSVVLTILVYLVCAHIYNSAHVDITGQPVGVSCRIGTQVLRLDSKFFYPLS